MRDIEQKFAICLRDESINLYLAFYLIPNKTLTMTTTIP